jgi:tetratricopeptide (TPR) repeat protein
MVGYSYLLRKQRSAISVKPTGVTPSPLGKSDASPIAVSPNPVRGYTPSATRARYEGKAAKECLDRASVIEASGDRDKAVEEYTKAIKLDSKNTQAYFKRGLLLKNMGMKPAAIADFRRVVDISDSPELSEQAKGHIAEMT